MADAKDQSPDNQKDNSAAPENAQDSLVPTTPPPEEVELKPVVSKALKIKKTRSAPGKRKFPLDMELVNRMVKCSMTEWQMAELIGVNEMTINRWKQEFPQFLSALKNRPMENGVVVRSLFERATGYNFQAEKIFMYDGRIIRAPYIEHVPPETTAINSWLNNRDPDNWKRNRVEGNGNGNGDTYVNGNLMQVNIDVHVTKLIDP